MINNSIYKTVFVTLAISLITFSQKAEAAAIQHPSNQASSSILIGKYIDAQMQNIKNMYTVPNNTNQIKIDLKNMGNLNIENKKNQASTTYDAQLKAAIVVAASNGDVELIRNLISSFYINDSYSDLATQLVIGYITKSGITQKIDITISTENLKKALPILLEKAKEIDDRNRNDPYKSADYFAKVIKAILCACVEKNNLQMVETYFALADTKAKDAAWSLLQNKPNDTHKPIKDFFNSKRGKLTGWY